MRRSRLVAGRTEMSRISSPALRMSNYDEAMLVGKSDEEESRLLSRVFGIGNGDREQVSEGG